MLVAKGAKELSELFLLLCHYYIVKQKGPQGSFLPILRLIYDLVGHIVLSIDNARIKCQYTTVAALDQASTVMASTNNVSA
jgi:hypothetical protein